MAALRAAGGADDDEGGEDMAHIDDGSDVPTSYTATVATTCVSPPPFISGVYQILSSARL